MLCCRATDRRVPSYRPPNAEESAPLVEAISGSTSLCDSVAILLLSIWISGDGRRRGRGVSCKHCFFVRVEC